MADPRDIGEWLALGTPHPVDPQSVGRGTAPTKLSSVDAGWMMAGLPSQIVAYLMCKFQGVESARYYAFVDLVDLALLEVKNWNPAPTIKEVRHVSHAALTEALGNGICKVCNGRKALAVEDKIIECEACGGQGRLTYSQRRASAILRMRRERVAKGRLDRLFDNLVSVLAGWEATGLETVAKRARNHPERPKSEVQKSPVSEGIDL